MILEGTMDLIIIIIIIKMTDWEVCGRNSSRSTLIHYSGIFHKQKKVTSQKTSVTKASN